MRAPPAVLLAALLGAACAEDPPAEPAGLGPRLDMATLHAAGGVPPGWRFRVPPGDAGRGRLVFAEQGCHRCHRVAGAGLPAPSGPGPELTGMGGHHPPAYFAEAILTPDAVRVEGPDYLGPDGRSRMPAYPALRLDELVDLVAYLASLTAPGAHAHGVHAVVDELPVDERPLDPAYPAPSQEAGVYLLQRYEIDASAVDAFVNWFRSEGGAALLAVDGLLGVETFVDRLDGEPAIASVFAFRDDAALATFLVDPTLARPGLAFDRFVGPHEHSIHRTPPLYGVPALSIRR